MIFDFGNAGFWGFFNDAICAFYEFIYGLGLCLTIPYDELFTYSGTAFNVFTDDYFNYGLGGVVDNFNRIILDYEADPESIPIAAYELAKFFLGILEGLNTPFKIFGDIVLTASGLPTGVSYPVWRILFCALPIIVVISLVGNVIKTFINIDI